jgi:hypothetical protein
VFPKSALADSQPTDAVLMFQCISHEQCRDTCVVPIVVWKLKTGDSTGNRRPSDVQASGRNVISFLTGQVCLLATGVRDIEQLPIEKDLLGSWFAKKLSP